MEPGSEDEEDCGSSSSGGGAHALPGLVRLPCYHSFHTCVV